MGYKVDYDAMQDLLLAYKKAIDEWDESVAEVIKKEVDIETSGNISGNKASCMKEYLSSAYGCSKDMLQMLLCGFYRGFMLYTEAYYRQADSARGARFDDEDLSERQFELQGEKRYLQQIGYTAEETIKSVSDLVAVSSPDIGKPDEIFKRILTSIDRLDGAVSELESTHASADFGEIDALISRLDAFLQELIGLKKEYKTTFSKEDFYSLASAPALIVSAHAMYDRLVEQEQDVAVASKNLADRLEQERAERKKKADWAKAGFGIAVGVISAALIIGTGPLGVAAVGAIGGAVTSAFNTAADEYTEKGWNTQDWNVDRIVAHGAIGAVTGAISSGLTAGMPNAGKFAKASIKALGSAIDGAAGTAYDQYGASGRITDVEAIVIETAKKSGSAFAGNYIGGKVFEKISDNIPGMDKVLNDPLDKVHNVAVFGTEGGKDFVSGIIKRGTSETIDQTYNSYKTGESIDYQKIGEKMLSPSEMTGDLIGGGLKGNITDQTPWYEYDPETNTTPIIQYKLGNMPNPETGKTLFEEYAEVDKSLYYMDGGETINKPYFASKSGERHAYLRYLDGGKYGGDVLEIKKPRIIDEH